MIPSATRILPRVLAEIQSRSLAMVEILRPPTLPPIPPRVLEAGPRDADPPGPSVMSEDLVRLVGAGVLGAFAQWAFNRVVRRTLPPPEERGPSRRVLGELRHIREQLDLLQGEIRGLGRRVGSLERGMGD